jgi:release factor glutamine methyltransferase
MIGKTPKQTLHSVLQAVPKEIDRLDAEVLLARLYRRDRSWLRVHDDLLVTAAMARKFRDLINRRRKHEPVAHLINEKEFYGRPFFVSKHVLIPRPETELLVDVALKHASDRPILWDVGTGSGAIGVTLARELLSATILATDVSSRALLAAKQNAKRHNATTQMTFLKSDLLQPAAFRWLKKHGKNNQLIITANLPYLPTSDKKELAPDVVKYEPSLALFSGSDGLTLIKRFLGQLSRHLPEWNYKEVIILLEYDPPQTRSLKQIAHRLFPDARIMVHRDLAKRDRVMEISV